MLRLPAYLLGTFRAIICLQQQYYYEYHHFHLLYSTFYCCRSWWLCVSVTPHYRLLVETYVKKGQCWTMLDNRCCPVIHTDRWTYSSRVECCCCSSTAATATSPDAHTAPSRHIPYCPEYTLLISFHFRRF